MSQQVEKFGWDAIETGHLATNSNEEADENGGLSIFGKEHSFLLEEVLDSQFLRHVEKAADLRDLHLVTKY